MISEIPFINGLVKIYEILRERPRIDTKAIFRIGVPNIGHDITIFNLTKNPIQIKHFNLIWRTKRLLTKTTWKEVDIFDDEDLGFTIEPYKNESIHFKDQCYFSFSRPNSKAKLYLDLHLAGGKRILKVLE